jgi:single-stranded-DNA-specific exonuclease
MPRKWVRPRSLEIPPTYIEAVGSRPLTELLFRRGYTTVDAALDFLSGGIDVDAPGLPDLEEGVLELTAAVLRGQRICVYGDYDTDGVTATALLVSLLSGLGADVTYYIPNRFRDGYGMNERAVRALAAEGTALLLTCDCGIRNVAEVALARQIGMRVVVTDHHELGEELPVAEAVINPKRLPDGHPCRMLPGVGTAYLVARQLLRNLDHDPAEADRWLDLVAVGIIADVVPLRGANRELARRGLARLNTSPCTGLQALMAVSGLQGHVTEEDVAFQLVPRINSAGRLADAGLGVRLLLTGGPLEGRDFANELDLLNQERKKLTASVAEAAAAEVSEGAGAIVLYRPEWHEGVLGIAAGRLAHEHGVPALLMARKHGGGSVLVGSARAPAGFALHEALAACAEHLLKHGGHDQAAGFSLLEDRFPAFRAAILEEARRRSRPDRVEPPRPADLAMPMSEVDRPVYDALRRAAPYGEANPDPVIFSRGVKLLSSRPIGPGEKHLRLVLRDGEQSFVGVWWGAGAMTLEAPREVDVFYHLGLNRWNGQEMLQAVVEHLGPAATIADEEEPAPAAEPGAGPEPRLGALEQPWTGRCELVDRRGADPWDVVGEFPQAPLFAEADRPPGLPTVDRYSLQTAPDLVLLTPPASPRLLDEAAARSGARRLIMAWPLQPSPEEERFLPSLLRLVAEEMAASPYVNVSRLAVRTGELEIVIRLALEALEESDLLAIDEEEGDILRLRRRTDGRGIKESPPLQHMRALLGESRAFRRFLRGAAPAAIDRVIYSG